MSRFFCLRGRRGVVHLERRLVLLRLRRRQEVRGGAAPAGGAVVRLDHFGDPVDAVGSEKGDPREGFHLQCPRACKCGMQADDKEMPVVSDGLQKTFVDIQLRVAHLGTVAVTVNR